MLLLKKKELNIIHKDFKKNHHFKQNESNIQKDQSHSQIHGKQEEPYKFDLQKSSQFYLMSLILLLRHIIIQTSLKIHILKSKNK